MPEDKDRIINDAGQSADDMLALVNAAVDRWAETHPKELEWSPEREAAMEAMSILATDMNAPGTRIITMDKTPDNRIAGITIADADGKIIFDEQLRQGPGADDGVIDASWKDVEAPAELPFSLSEKEKRLVETLKDARNMIFQKHADYELFKQEIEGISYPKEPMLPRKILAIAADGGISVARTIGTLALGFSLFAKPSLLGPLTSFIKGVAFGYRRSQARGISKFRKLMAPFRIALAEKIRERREIEGKQNDVLKEEAAVWKKARKEIRKETKDLYGRSIDIGRYNPSESRIQTFLRHQREEADGYTKHGFPSADRIAACKRIFSVGINLSVMPPQYGKWPDYSREYSNLRRFDRKISRFLNRLEKISPTPGKDMRDAYGRNLIELIQKRTQIERISASSRNREIESRQPEEKASHKQNRTRRKTCRI